MEKTVMSPATFPLLFFCFSLAYGQQSPTPSRTKAKPSTSTPACPDSTTLPRDQRTPDNCAKAAFAEYGYPVMFDDAPREAHWGIFYGVSASPGNSNQVSIWMDNQTDSPQTNYLCCEATFSDYIDLYDAQGRRVPVLDPVGEKQRAGEGTTEAGWVCSCSGFVNVPPHTLKIIDSGHLDRVFKLSPGRYTIVERPSNPTKPGAPPPSSPTIPSTGPRLTITLP